MSDVKNLVRKRSPLFKGSRIGNVNDNCSSKLKTFMDFWTCSNLLLYQLKTAPAGGGRIYLSVQQYNLFGNAFTFKTEKSIVFKMKLNWNFHSL